jgi:hypothetical protein
VKSKEKKPTPLNLLAEHKFTKCLLDNNKNSIDAYDYKNSEYGKPNYFRPLTKKEQNDIDVLRYALEILSWCEHLQHIPIYISNYHETRPMKKGGITWPKFLTYQIENYLIRVNGIYDRVLKLVNVVFELSNDPKYCYENVILKNLKVKQSNIPAVVKKLKKTLEDYNVDRNEIIHHLSYSDKDLNELEMFFFVNQRATPEEREKEVASSFRV